MKKLLKQKVKKDYFGLVQLLLTMTLLTIVQTAYVNIISTDPEFKRNRLTGAMTGGTRLFIKGSGFDEANFDNQVFVGQYSCVIDNYYTTQGFLVCDLPEMFYGPHKNLKVAVKVKGNYVPCNHFDCTLDLELRYTPQLHSVHPQSVFSGDQINIYGVWKSDKVSDMKAIRISDRNCIRTKKQEDDDKLSFWGFTSFECSVPEDLEVGDHMLSVISSKGTGFSLLRQESFGFQVGTKLDKYNVRVHPLIESISAQSGFMSGQVLEIRGKGFGGNKEAVNVEMGGAKCKVLKVEPVREIKNGQEISYDRILCELAPIASEFTKKVFKGGAGLRNQVFDGYDKKFDNHLGTVVGKTLLSDKILLSTENRLNGTRYMQKLWGIFRSTEKGLYRFKIAGDDQVRLYLSNSPVDFTQNFDPKNMLKVICDQPRWTNYREFHRFPSQICDVQLEANTDYYMMAFQTEGGGRDSMTIAVEVPNTNADRLNTKPQVQKIEIRNNPVFQILSLDLLNATGGNFKLTFMTRDLRTGRVNYFKEVKMTFDVSASKFCYLLQRRLGTQMECVREHINANFQVVDSPGAGFRWTVTFLDYRSRNVLPTVTTSELEGTNIDSKIQEMRPQTDPIAGTFKLKYGGHITESINYFDSWSQVKKRLESLSPLAKGVSVYHLGAATAGREWYVVMDSIKGNGLDLEIAEDNITGGSSDIPKKLLITPDFEPASTSLVFLPIPPDFLRTLSDVPQLNVTVGNVLAGCQAQDCNYSLIPEAQTPKVTSFNLNATNGVLTIAINVPSPGQRILTVSEISTENIFVRFANVECSLISVSTSQVTCQLPFSRPNKLQLETGSFVPQVHLKNGGYFTVDQSVTPYSVPLEISRVSPSQGSIAGGTMITIEGTGFAANSDYGNQSIVKINGQACAIQSFSTDQIICETPANSGNLSAQLTVEVNGNNAISNKFSYSDKSTPSITSLSPNNTSPVLKQNLEIAGANFGNDTSDLTVRLKSENGENEYECNAFRVTDNLITCRFGGGKSGSYRVQIHRKGMGNSIAASVNSDLLVLEIRVTSVTPNEGSFAGGTVLTIQGNNFSTVPKENQVVIGDSGNNHCVILTATSTTLTCRVNQPKERVTDPQDVHVLARIQEKAVCKGTCKFTFKSELTATVDGVSPMIVSAGDLITVKGTKFSGASKLWLDQHEISNFSVLDDSTISFNMPSLVFGTYQPRILIGNKGFAQLNISQKLENKLEMTSIKPNVAYVDGTIMTINGNGFNPEIMKVMLKNKTCIIESFTHTQIVCRMPSYNTRDKDLPVIITFMDDNNTKQDIKCPNCVYKTVTNYQRIWNKQNLSFTNLANVTFDVRGSYLDKEYSTNTPYQLDKARVWLRTSDKFDRFAVQGKVNSFDSKWANLTFLNIPAGVYYLEYHNDLAGFVRTNWRLRNLTFAPQVNPVTPVNSSLAGGSEVTITGKGFPVDNLKQHAQVKICGQMCKIVSSSYTQIKCLTPVLNTLEVQNKLNMLSPQIQRNAVVTGDVTRSNMNNVIDGNINTYYSGMRNSDCFVQLDYGQNSVVRATKIKMFPRVNGNEMLLVGGRIEGSLDGVNYSTYATIDETVVENWNQFMPDTEKNEIWEFRYLRFKGGKRYCQVAELEVIGYEFAILENFDMNTPHVCDVDVSVRGASLATPIPQVVTYSLESTPEVTGLSPDMGTTAGGTLLTISGKNFHNDSVVLLDDVICQIKELSSTKIKCTTGRRNTFRESTLVIKSNSVGYAATHGNVFLYIDRWSDPMTWGGEAPPRTGDSVHVPKGQSLLVDVSTPELYAVVVEGTLLFEDVQELTMDAWFIVVREGRFIIGTPEKPHLNKVTITMHGTRESKMLPGFGNKSIMVHNGQIDIHGKPLETTWTVLETHACAGDSQIKLNKTVDWAVGDEIVIAPTGRDRNEDEQRVIKRINGNNIILDKPLEFDHFSGIVDPTDLGNGGKGVINCANRGTRRILQETNENQKTSFELRGEVGLLTRNIKIQGDESTMQTGHGVHIMVRGESDFTKGRFSYLEVFRAGQKFLLGKYPLHYHMMGHVHDMYIKGCAIHQTFNRGTTIHGVHYLVVEDNVYHRTMGHTIFLEDGIETNNIIQRNLVIHVSVASSLLMSDMDPSGLWQARPRNFIRDNHFVGSAGNGAWFELVGRPTGPSSTSGICPLGEELLQYDRNVHHSNSLGLRVYPVYIPKTNSCMSNTNMKLRDPYSENPGVPARFRKNIMYMNGTGTFGKKIGAVTYVDQVLISNGTNQTVAEPDNAKDSLARVEGGISVGHSQLTDFHVNADNQPRFLTMKALGFGRKSGFLVKDQVFYNFGNGTFLTTCGSCGNEKKRTPGGVRNNFENVKLINVTAPLITFRDALYDKDIIYDKTGSLIAQMKLKDSIASKYQNGGWITPYFPHLKIPECFKQEDTTICSKPCSICTNEIRLKTLRHKVIDNQNLLYGQDMKLLNLNIDGGSFNENMNQPGDEEKFGVNKFRNCQLSIGFRGWLSVLATNYKYNYHFGKGVEWKKMQTSNNYYWGLEGPELPIYLRHNHTEHRELYDSFFTGVDQNEEWREGSNKIQDESVDGVNVILNDGHNFGEYFYDAAKETITWKIDEKRIGFFETEAVYCRDHCPQEDDTPEDSIIETNTRKWSDQSAWEELGRLPREGDVITIKKTWNMLLDIATPKLKHLKIQGRLRFDRNAATTEIHSHLIEIHNGGELLVGSSTAPFTGKAKINLYGSKSDDDLVIGPEIAPVNKAILNKGKLHLYGNPPTQTWLRLAKKITAGSSSLFVTNKDHGWAKDDQLVVASSSTKHEERELVTIERVIPGSSEIIIKEQFQFNHYGSSEVLTTEQGELDMRAEVGNLTRNVVIESDLEDEWGCTILTPSFVTVTKLREVNQGSLKFDGVEIRNCGQRDTKKAAVDFNWLLKANQIQSISRSTFNNGQGWAVNMFNSKGISLTNNVFYNARKFGIFMDRVSDVTIENNLIVGIKKRENYENKEYDDLLVGIYYNDNDRHWDRNRIKVRFNHVSSAPWFGFAVPGFNCSNKSVDMLNFYGNTAHSCMAGWIPTKLKNQNCAQFSHFTAYKNDEQGFVQRVDIDNIKVKNFILADNRNGIVINGGNGSKYPFIWFEDSVIIGKALIDCPECYTGSECETSGFISGLFNRDPYDFYFEKTRLPLHNSTNVNFSFGGRQTLEKVVFRNFNDSVDCQNQPTSVAVKMNNFYQDNTNYVHMKNLTVDNVPLDNRFYFANHKRHKDTPAYCGKRDCSGNYNTLFIDEDGAFFEQKMHFFGNNQGAGRDGSCTFFEKWNGFACNPDFMQLLVTRGKGSGVIFPLTLKIEEYPKTFTGEAKFNHQTDSPKTITNLVKKGHTTTLQTAGLMPSGMAYQLFTESGNDWAVFKVQAEDPSTMVVLAENPFNNSGKNEVTPEILRAGQELDMTQYKNKCGANHYNASTRTIHFLIRGIHCKVTVEFANALEVNTLLNIDPDKFYEDDGMTTFIDRLAALLGIDLNRIKVVDLSNGGSSNTTSLTTSIRSATFLENDPRSASDVEVELNQYKEKIEKAVADGTLNVDAQIINASARVRMRPEDRHAVGKSLFERGRVGHKNANGFKIVLVVVGLILAGLIMMVCWMKRRREEKTVCQKSKQTSGGEEKGEIPNGRLGGEFGQNEKEEFGLNKNPTDSIRLEI